MFLFLYMIFRVFFHVFLPSRVCALVLWSQKFYELRANHEACFANASGGDALRPPPQPPSSQVQVECLNFFSRVLYFFFQGLVGVKPLNLFSRGCIFFPGPTHSHSPLLRYLKSLVIGNEIYKI